MSRFQVHQAHVKLPSLPLHTRALASPRFGWCQEGQKRALTEGVQRREQAVCSQGRGKYLWCREGRQERAVGETGQGFTTMTTVMGPAKLQTSLS